MPEPQREPARRSDPPRHPAPGPAPAAEAPGWQRVRRVGKRLLPEPVVERVRGWREARHRARKERARAEGRPVESRRDAHEKLYWRVSSLFHAVLGDGRVLVRMAPDDPWSVDVQDTRSGFHGLLRVAPDTSQTEAFVLDAAGARSLGHFDGHPQAGYALLRSLLDHDEAQREAGSQAPSRRIWIPLEEGRPVPRLLRVGPQWSSALHRSGWGGAMETVASLHDERGVLFDGFLEATFCWRDTGRVYETPWVGVSHTPPETPAWTGATNDDLFGNERFRRSLPWCRGLFVLSEHHRAALRKRVDLPVSVVPLPTEVPERTFSMRAFEQNPHPRLVQIGHWLRHPDSLYRLRAPGLQKTRLDVGHPWEEGVRAQLASEEGAPELESVEVMPRLPDGEYDALLARNLVFLHLLGSSANNAVVECIVRATPLLVNRLPAVAEYLGADYPLYFDDLEDAARKATDRELVRLAHWHLRTIPRERFSREAFLAAVVDSEVYRTLRAEAGTALAPSVSRHALPFRDEASRVLLFHASHHKAGTHWLLRILHGIATRYGLRLAHAGATDPARDPAPDVLIDDTSRTDPDWLPPFRGSHMIRDPRDMVVSGYFYHRWTHEAWVHVPEARYDGLTFQQYLNAVDTEAGLLEEIERCTYTFDLMRAWRYDDPRFFEIRYEELMHEGEALFRRLFHHYGFAEEAVEVALEVARQNSFERSAGRHPGQAQDGSILRSGLPGQWREHFTPRVAARFHERHGDLLTRLGYADE